MTVFRTGNFMIGFEELPRGAVELNNICVLIEKPNDGTVSIDITKIIKECPSAYSLIINYIIDYISKENHDTRRI